MQKLKIRTVLGLILLYLAILLNLEWVWGILFLIWVIPDLFSGITYFIEPVEKKSSPLLYWIIMISWLWMSLYMMATPFFPELYGESYKVMHPAKESGIYQDTFQSNLNLNSLDTPLNHNATSVSQKANKPAIKDSLKYKSYAQKETHYFVGISADMNINDPDIEKHTNELWEYFYTNDISQVISDIIDERIYFIYSKADNAGNYKATIAFRTQGIDNLYEGLEGLSIPPGKYAVFEHKGKNADHFITNTWAKIYESDLAVANGFNMEVYTLDNDYNVEKAEIRVAIQQ
ncbi:MAG: effector binding domain-containing protein [Chitinophagales bacterium]|nr:effector binding domain-containing protein [Chitinophagales bacterium]